MWYHYLEITTNSLVSSCKSFLSIFPFPILRLLTRSSRLQWFGNVEHKDDADWGVKWCMTMKIEETSQIRYLLECNHQWLKWYNAANTTDITVNNWQSVTQWQTPTWKLLLIKSTKISCKCNVAQNLVHSKYLWEDAWRRPGGTVRGIRRVLHSSVKILRMGQIQGL